MAQLSRLGSLSELRRVPRAARRAERWCALPSSPALPALRPHFQLFLQHPQLLHGRYFPWLVYNYWFITGLAVSVKGLEYKWGCHPTCSLRALNVPPLRACFSGLYISVSALTQAYYLPHFLIFRVTGVFVPVPSPRAVASSILPAKMIS